MADAKPYFEINLRIKARFSRVNFIAVVVTLAITCMTILNYNGIKLPDLGSDEIELVTQIYWIVESLFKLTSRKKIK